MDGASQHVDVAERQSVGIVSHVLPPWAPEWQLRQENMSLLPQLLARTAMGKCQSETSAFCFERLLCYLYPLQLLILNTVWFLLFVLLFFFSYFFLVYIFHYSSLCLSWFDPSIYHPTVFTNSSNGCFQTLFLQHLPVRVTVNSFIVTAGVVNPVQCVDMLQVVACCMSSWDRNVEALWVQSRRDQPCRQIMALLVKLLYQKISKSEMHIDCTLPVVQCLSLEIMTLFLHIIHVVVRSFM